MENGREREVMSSLYPRRNAGHRAEVFPGVLRGFGTGWAMSVWFPRPPAKGLNIAFCGK